MTKAAKRALKEKQVPLRELSNPPQRLPLRADFPGTVCYKKTRLFAQILDEELRKAGTTLQQIKRINIVYPHKHPELFPGHVDNAKDCLKDFQRFAQKAAPNIRWVTADAICETVKLGRSENQTSAHALMRHQVYDIYKPLQKEDLPFIHAHGQEKEFFIVIDWCVEQGTTLANLISYITHNGGTVLAASCTQEKSLVQRAFEKIDGINLAAEFKSAGKNCARIPQLAHAFSQSAKRAGKSWTPSECLEMFESCLNSAGNSVFALTDGECQRVLDTMSGEYRGKAVEFPALLAQMKNSISNRR